MTNAGLDPSREIIKEREFLLIDSVVDFVTEQSGP
jgi:hypothetical protein